MTVDRVGGLALAVLALFTLEESYRLRLPLGSLQNPGPAYVPVLLALLMLGLGVLVAALGARTAPLAVIESREWRHAVAILLVCAFMALALERIGYRLTIFLSLAALLGLLERQRWLTTLLFSDGHYAIFVQKPIAATLLAVGAVLLLLALRPLVTKTLDWRARLALAEKGEN